MAIALKSTILLTDVFETLFNKSDPNPTPFSIIAISYDAKRETGGEILKLDNCIVPTSKRVGNKPQLPVFSKTKNAAHRKNNTINLLNKNNDTFIKVHIDLIVEFNNQKVIW